jgi:hypothetical protein
MPSTAFVMLTPLSRDELASFGEDLKGNAD